MKRTMRVLGIAITMLLLASAALAENANQRVVGKKGVGYFSGVAPVGMRYWMNDGMAIDVGVGMGLDTKIPVPASPTNETTSFFDFAFDVGLPWVLHGEENMIVYFRPGVTVAGEQQFDTGTAMVLDDKAYETTIAAQLGLGGEFFLGQLGWPNLSFSGDVGVGVEIVNPAVDGVDTDVNFATFKNDVNVVNTGSIGFHIYF
jgi:hypothetical protein